jgi:hypothetical protein
VAGRDDFFCVVRRRAHQSERRSYLILSERGQELREPDETTVFEDVQLVDERAHDAEPEAAHMPRRRLGRTGLKTHAVVFHLDDDLVRPNLATDLEPACLRVAMFDSVGDGFPDGTLKLVPNARIDSGSREIGRERTPRPRGIFTAARKAHVKP